jgi:hypothetical protein
MAISFAELHGLLLHRTAARILTGKSSWRLLIIPQRGENMKRLHVFATAIMILTLTGCVGAVLSPTPMPPSATPFPLTVTRAPPSATLIPPSVTPTLVASSPTATSQPNLWTKDKSAADSAEAIVKELVAAKLEAMKAKDIKRYLALITETDKEYYIEQRNWFLIYLDAVTSDFTIEVIKAQKINDTMIIASLHQH